MTCVDYPSYPVRNLVSPGRQVSGASAEHALMDRGRQWLAPGLLRDAWYWCEVTESEVERPDFSKIPEDVRAMVVERWQRSNEETKRWKMWGPQILWYRSVGYQVAVVGPVA